MFYGGKDSEMLPEIIPHLGTNDFKKMIARYNINITPDQVDEKFGKKYTERDNAWSKFLHGLPARRKPPADAIDLLNKMLLFDYTERYDAVEALKHPYFEKLGDPFDSAIDRGDETMPKDVFPYTILKELKFDKSVKVEDMYQKPNPTTTSTEPPPSLLNDTLKNIIKKTEEQSENGIFASEKKLDL